MVLLWKLVSWHNSKLRNIDFPMKNMTADNDYNNLNLEILFIFSYPSISVRLFFVIMNLNCLEFKLVQILEPAAQTLFFITLETIKWILCFIQFKRNYTIYYQKQISAKFINLNWIFWLNSKPKSLYNNSLCFIQKSFFKESLWT